MDWTDFVDQLTAFGWVDTATVVSELAPVQVEGVLRDGQHFYMRARYSTVWLGLGDSEEQANADIYGHGHQRTVGTGLSDYAASYLSPRDALDLMVGMLTDRGVVRHASA